MVYVNALRCTLAAAKRVLASLQVVSSWEARAKTFIGNALAGTSLGMNGKTSGIYLCSLH
jgi:hypothetical protein